MYYRTYANAQGEGSSQSTDDALIWWTQLTASPDAVSESGSRVLTVSRRVEACAWSCLARLHIERSVDADNVCNADSVFRAANCADNAAALGLVSPAVISIGTKLARYKTQYPTADEELSFDAPRFRKLTFLHEALERRNREYEAEQQQRELKTSHRPAMYICAAEGCGIEATKKSGLKACSGACPAERKPRYCSKECQKKVGSGVL